MKLIATMRIIIISDPHHILINMYKITKVTNNQNWQKDFTKNIV